MKHLTIPLERDYFMRKLVRELASTLEEVVGLEEASGYIGIVGQKIGAWLDSLYKSELNVRTLDQRQVAEVLVDLKRRICGRFEIQELDDDKMVFNNTACPFEQLVIGCPSMCMMTSNVFGYIASRNLGYAKVCLEETIANGDDRCLVKIYTRITVESENASGREYFGDI